MLTLREIVKNNILFTYDASLDELVPLTKEDVDIMKTWIEGMVKLIDNFAPYDKLTNKRIVIVNSTLANELLKIHNETFEKVKNLPKPTRK